MYLAKIVTGGEFPDTKYDEDATVTGHTEEKVLESISVSREMGERNTWDVFDPSGRRYLRVHVDGGREGFPTDEIALLGFQAAEHEAWGEVVLELRDAGVGEINRGEPNERLHDFIVWWAEELAQLRLHDLHPEHAKRGLLERRAKVAAWKEGK